eukprot:scaffold71275_cov39-Prasinocladus_malaysianus.AAC.1
MACMAPIADECQSDVLRRSRGVQRALRRGVPNRNPPPSVPVLVLTGSASERSSESDRGSHNAPLLSLRHVSSFETDLEWAAWGFGPSVSSALASAISSPGQSSRGHFGEDNRGVAAAVSWSGLPEGVVEQIAERLPAHSAVNVMGVGRVWLDAVKQSGPGRQALDRTAGRRTGFACAWAKAGHVELLQWGQQYSTA